METNISADLNITLTEHRALDDESNRFPQALCLTAISMFYIEAAVKIYKKNRNNLEPIHIFEINTLTGIFFFLLLRELFYLLHFVVEVKFLCLPQHWLAYYWRLNIFAGIILSQFDRFFALHWHAKYKERVTPYRAKVFFSLNFSIFSIHLIFLDITDLDQTPSDNSSGSGTERLSR